MTLIDIIRNGTRALALGATLTFGSMYVSGCGGDQSTKDCKTDVECKGDRVCVDGVCQGSNAIGNSSESICVQYKKMCPFQYDGETGKQTTKFSLFGEDYDVCMLYCVGGNWESGIKDVKDMCGFLTCALETGYCDNEVAGDVQIKTCMDEHNYR